MAKIFTVTVDNTRPGIVSEQINTESNHSKTKVTSWFLSLDGMATPIRLHPAMPSEGQYKEATFYRTSEGLPALKPEVDVDVKNALILIKGVDKFYVPKIVNCPNQGRFLNRTCPNCTKQPNIAGFHPLSGTIEIWRGPFTTKKNIWNRIELISSANDEKSHLLFLPQHTSLICTRKEEDQTQIYNLTWSGEGLPTLTRQEEER